MTAIAVVSVTAVVAWARLAPGGGDRPAAGAEQEVPTTLAGGRPPEPVPEPIAAAVEGPVVGAATLDELSDEMMSACTEFNPVAWDAGSPTLEYAILTTDGVTASLFGQGAAAGGMGKPPGGEDAIGLRVRCDLELRDGQAINRGGGGFEEVFPGQPGFGGHSMGSSCCDENGMGTATATVDVPPEAAWLLQERGSWHLAIPVAEVDSLGVSWKYRENRFGGGGPPASRVLFVDAGGTIISEDFVGGPF